MPPDVRKRLLRIYEQNLEHLEEQAARYGGENYTPLNVMNQIRDHREIVERISSDVLSPDELREYEIRLSVEDRALLGFDARNSATAKGGDRSINIAGTIVGSDINVHQGLIFSRTTILFMLVVLLLGVTVAFYYYYSPIPMSGKFNIAIADFGYMDKNGVTSLKDGVKLADDARSEFEKVISDTNDIIQTLRVKGIVSGNTPEEQETTAASIAQSMNADVLIYGYIDGSDPFQRWLTPKFTTVQNI